MAFAGPSNITIVGIVGDAAGKELRRVTCMTPTCAEALGLCHAQQGCDTVEVVLPSKRDRRRAAGQEANGKTSRRSKRRAAAARKGLAEPTAVLRAS